MGKTDMKTVRVRYAPSPTGDFHVGGARTALFNYLFARHHKGKFILRIEDTDKKRYKSEAETQLLNGLKYLELEWDEGPDIGGPYGPYRQSQRLEIYQKFCSILIAQGKAYRCFCPVDAQQVKETNSIASIKAGYNRKCRNIEPEEAEFRAKSGELYTVRLKLPLEGNIEVIDVIRGKITFRNDETQDVIIMKSNGFPTYHLANVVDDHLMKITHILRGEEWINSTPLHLHLYQALGWIPPIMAQTLST